MTVLCTVTFAVLGLVLKRYGVGSVPTPVFLAMVGAALGYLFEMRRTERTTDSARRALDPVADGTGDIQQGRAQERASTLLGFSHDLRSPLQIVQFAVDVMRMRCSGDAQLMGVITDTDQALQQMKRMLADLVATASGKHAKVRLTAQRVAIPDLTERLRRRLGALMHDRDIRTRVECSRSAPDVIEIDSLVVDRVVDNLLSNAAKYTERGRVEVELAGTPGFLVVQVLDTGCGIAPEAMSRIFEPGGSSPDSRRGDSFGVGLSVVTRLLEQVGGHLEVMSSPGEGTTFWVHLPVRARADDQPSGMRPRLGGNVSLSRVVRIRSRSA